jgi:hypothetical protein
MISLEEARTDVDGWLDEVKLRTGKCSGLLRNELAEGMRNGTISAFAVLNEIGQMEGSDPRRPTGTKPKEPLRHELHGLMHKHYKASSMPSFMLNISNHWTSPRGSKTQRRKIKAQRRKIESDFQRDGHAGKAVHGIVLDGYQARHAANQMTGEWIVYAEVAGVNYYLTLASHDEARENQDAILARAQSCVTEFPELRGHPAFNRNRGRPRLRRGQRRSLPSRPAPLLTAGVTAGCRRGPAKPRCEGINHEV